MIEYERFETLDKARTLFQMEMRMKRASNGSRTREGTRQKLLETAPVVLKERMLTRKNVPTYTIDHASASPLIRGVLTELMYSMNDDVFEELFEMMRVPWYAASE